MDSPPSLVPTARHFAAARERLLDDENRVVQPHTEKHHVYISLVIPGKDDSSRHEKAMIAAAAEQLIHTTFPGYKMAFLARDAAEGSVSIRMFVDTYNELAEVLEQNTLEQLLAQGKGKTTRKGTRSR
jgi:hypothetical protein